MTEIVACLNGCTRRHVDGSRYPVRVAPPILVCHRCTDRLELCLREIPDYYARLPRLLTHGSIDDDAARYGKRADAPAPMRLDVVDLLDTRRGRRRDGQAAADRHGVIGLLAPWADLVGEQRRVQAPAGGVGVTSRFLLRHLEWISQQPWVDELTRELRTLHRQLGDAVGIHPPTPVGHCTATDADGNQCDGPLWPTRVGGVICGTCGDRWSSQALARLGAKIGVTA